MPNNTSQHILNASANLLGFCLFVITSLRITSRAESHLIDKLTSVVAISLTCCCIFSFASLRTRVPVREKRLEKIADYFFIFSLVGILVIILFITMNYLH